jgi:uncharacterized phage protein (TIGR02220 family)
MSILHLLSSNGFLTINKKLARTVGLDAAALLADLASAHLYWENNNKLDNGFFYRTQAEIEENTTLSQKVQLKCMKILEMNGLVTTKLKGLPAVKHYRINQSRLAEMLSLVLPNVEYSIDKKENLDSTECRINKNIEDVHYFFELNQILDLLSERTGAKYNLPKTVATLKKYQNYTLVKSLLENGHSLEQIFKVIEFKCKEWLPDAKMCTNLVPSVLFRQSNFEKYIIQSQIKSVNNQTQQIKDDKGNYADTQAGRELFITDIREGVKRRLEARRNGETDYLGF